MFKRKAVAALLITVLLFSSVINVSAAGQVKKFNVRVSSVTAVPGDQVVLNVGIENNPGIMAVTVTVHFDPEVFEYDKYVVGILKIDTLALHNGYLSVVYCRKDDLTDSGTLFGLGLRVKENAPAGAYPITVKNSRCEDTLTGAFANRAADKLEGTAYVGEVKVGYTGNNCVHSFNDYTQDIPAGCTTVGSKSRSCKICGHTETAEIVAAGHSYSECWYIDTPAAAGQSGVISRHCSRCDAVKDKIRYSLEEAAKCGLTNNAGDEVSSAALKALLQEDASGYENNGPEFELNGGSNEQEEYTPILEIKDEADEDNASYNKPPVTADELVAEVNSADKTTYEKWYSYFLGDNGNTGILNIIRSSIPEKLPNIIYWLIALLAVICGILT